MFWDSKSDLHVVILSLRELSTGKFEYVFDRLSGMDGYHAAIFEQRAPSGDVTSAIAVLSCPSLKPEIRPALLTDLADDEIRFEIIARSDMTPEEIDWAVRTTENTCMLKWIPRPRQSSCKHPHKPQGAI